MNVDLKSLSRVRDFVKARRLCVDLLRMSGVLCALALARSGIADILVIDDRGRQVVLTQPARRVIAMTPHLGENLAALGAAESLVACVDYCDFPHALQRLPRVGSGGQFSVEAILSHKPDLVLVWASDKSLQLVQMLEKLGIAVYVDDPRVVADVPASLRRLGQLVGKTTEAEGVSTAFEAKFEQLRQRYQAQSPVKVFYQIWNQPMQSLNGQHLVSDLIRLCGGVNVFAEAAVLAPLVSREAVLLKNPEVIVASGVDAGRPPWLDDWTAWPQLQAVRLQALFSIPPDWLQRHSLRLTQGAEAMCAQIDSARQKRSVLHPARVVKD